MHTADSLTIAPQRMEELRAWQGRTEDIDDVVTLAPLRGLAATLDRVDRGADATSAHGAVPPLWHWLYFLPRAAHSDVATDGHPRRGGFLPPVPLPRRMWAGGRLEWHGTLRAGDPVQRRSRIVSVTHKAGRTGDLVFVVVRHEFFRGDERLMSEEQDLVYRAPPQPGDPVPAPQAAPSGAAWSRDIVADPVLLFRYSALTFNSHRIHYDRPYAVHTEGYPGLVVQGPLIATLLADLVQRERPAAMVRRFSFKAVRPVFDLHPLRVCGQLEPDGKSAKLWAQDHEGWLTMQARITFD